MEVMAAKKERKTILMDISTIVQALAQAKGLKGVLSVLFSAIAGILLPVSGAIAFCVLLVVGDSLTGWMASRKRGESFSVSKFGKTVTKMGVYSWFIIMATLVDYSYLKEVPAIGDHPLTYLMSFYIIVTEFLSNVKNGSEITGIDFYSRLKQIPKLAAFEASAWKNKGKAKGA